MKTNNCLSFALIFTLVILISCIIWLFPTFFPDAEEHVNLQLDQLFYSDAEVSPNYEFKYLLVGSDVPHASYRGSETQIKAFKSTSDVGFFLQYIFRFRNELTAIYDQKAIREFYFSDGEPVEKISYVSPYADVWWYKCGPTTHGYYCTVISRYDEIIIVTTFSNDDSLTGSEIDRMLEIFDNRANKLLN